VRYVGIEDPAADSILELWQTLPIPVYVPESGYSHAGATIAYRDVVRRVIARFEDRLAVVAGKRMDVFEEVVSSPTYGIAVDYILPLTWVQFEQFNWSRSGVPTFAKLHVRNYTTADTSVLENEIEHALMWLLLKGDGQLPWPSPVWWFRGNSVDLSNPDLVVGPLADEDYRVIALALELGPGADLRSVVDNVNRAPIAVVGYPEGTQKPGTPIRVDASASYDPDDDALIFSFRQVQGFDDAEILDAQSSSPSVVLPRSGNYVFEMVVKDARGLQDAVLVRMYALADCPEPIPVKTKSDLIVAAYYVTMWGRENYWAGFADANTGDRSIDFTLGAPDHHSLLGNYDCADPLVADWHIKMALEHGVNCFIVPNGRPAAGWSPEKNFEDGFLHSRYVDRIKFFMLFNTEPWWSSDALNAIIPLDSLIDETIGYYCDNYFSHPSYLRVDGKPVVMLYHAFIFREVRGHGAAGKAAYEAYVERVRSAARSKGVDLYIIGDTVTHFFDDAWLQSLIGPVDAAGSYGSIGREWTFRYGIPYIEESWSAYESGCGEEWAYFSALATRSERAFAPNLSVGTDNSLPFDLGFDNWLVSRPTPTPPEFGAFLRSGLGYVSEGLNLLTVYAWNEFHEGGVLEPTHESGYSYLEALRDVVAVEPDSGWAPTEEP
jgi:hypothetical protein